MSACLLSVVLWTACSGGDHRAHRGVSASPTVDGDLAGTVAGLCLAHEQASTDTRAAKATYEARARRGVETINRALRPSNSILAGTVARASAAVEADLAPDPPRPTLRLTLGRLTETIREGLARLGVSTSACEK